MKSVLAIAAILLLAGPAVAAPGDPRALRGSLEWPPSLSVEPFIVVRGDDGQVYYADVTGARRMSAGSIVGPISLVGIEGNQRHEIAAVVVGSGDSALTFVAPTVPAPAEPATAPSSLPRQAATPMPPAVVPSPPPAPTVAIPAVAGSSGGEDLWRIHGKVTAVSGGEFLVETGAGETVRVDVSNLSSWTRESVRAGDQVKLFGVPQKDHRLVANGFIQELPARGASSR